MYSLMVLVLVCCSCCAGVQWFLAFFGLTLVGFGLAFYALFRQVSVCFSVCVRGGGWRGSRACTQAGSFCHVLWDGATAGISYTKVFELSVTVQPQCLMVTEAPNPVRRCFQMSLCRTANSLILQTYGTAWRACFPTW